MSGLRNVAGEKSRRHLYVRVHLDAGGTASLFPTTIVTTSDKLSTGQPEGSERFTFTLSTESGAVEQEVAFAPVACAIGTDASQIVSAFVPIPGEPVSDPGKCTLKLSRDGKDLLAETLPDRAPGAAFVSAPEPGATASGRQDVAWTLDAKTPQETATLWFSADEATWIPLVIASESGSLSIDFDQLPAGEKCVLRLVACGGLASTTVDAEPFAIAVRDATVTVVEPGAVAATAPGVALRVAATAHDGDGSPLEDGERFAWTSDLDGALGLGSSRRIVLATTGEHKVGVAVKLESGASAEATCSVRVARSKVRILHVVAAKPGRATSVIAHPALDGRPDALLLVTAVFNPGGSKGVRCPHPVAAGYDGTHWRLSSTDGRPLPAGAAFAIDIVQPGPTAFAASGPALAHWLLDARPDAVVLGAQIAMSYGREHAVGAARGARFNGKSRTWSIVDAQGVAVTPDTVSAIEALRPGAEAFVHVSKKATLHGPLTRIDHPALNGNPDALFQVSPIWPDAATPQHGPYGLRYDGKHWNVFREDDKPIPAGAAYAIAL